MSEYRIVEENRQIWIEQLVKGKSWDSWVAVDKPNVPRYHPTVADARSWVETLRRGRVIHSVEDDGLQWFLDRVGKTVVRDAMRVVILDTDHARHLHTASVEMGYVYHDAETPALTESDLEWVDSRPFNPSEVRKVITAYLNAWDEMDDDMASANVPTSEIVGLLNHWRNKYTITRKDAPNLPVDERKAYDGIDNGTKSYQWFKDRIGMKIWNITKGYELSVFDEFHCSGLVRTQNEVGFRYSDYKP